MVCETGLAMATGNGCTATVTAIGNPVQPLASGTTVYVTCPETFPVVFRIWAIKFPLPAVAPETFVAEAVQLKVVPGMAVNAIAVGFPEQIVCVAGVANATGVTGWAFIVTFAATEIQPEAFLAITVCDDPAANPP